jgi:hypothetical protein
MTTTLPNSALDRIIGAVNKSQVTETDGCIVAVRRILSTFDKHRSKHTHFGFYNPANLETIPLFGL